MKLVVFYEKMEHDINLFGCFLELDDEEDPDERIDLMMATTFIDGGLGYFEIDPVVGTRIRNVSESLEAMGMPQVRTKGNEKTIYERRKLMYHLCKEFEIEPAQVTAT